VWKCANTLDGLKCRRRCAILGNHEVTVDNAAFTTYLVRNAKPIVCWSQKHCSFSAIRYSACMIRKIVVFLFCSLPCLYSTLLVAQEESPRDRLVTARAQYYAPAIRGLRTFHCDASFDWKAMMARYTSKEIPDDNPWLKYLQTVQFSVDDELRGKGSLQWTSPNPPPAGTEQALKQTEEGLQMSVAGFFQGWNAFMNGSMVPFPDSTVTVTKSGDGVHMSGTSKDLKFDEDFDKNMVLTQALADSPAMKILAIPTYANTPDGLIVSAVDAKVSQPSSAPQIETVYRIEYAKVGSFQIPSHVFLDIKNTGVIEFGLNNCTVSVADWAEKN
jgi:hypothetical protein